jgi:hypothetical protein
VSVWNFACGATFSRAWKLAGNVLVSHIPVRPGRRLDDLKLMSANRRYLG